MLQKIKRALKRDWQYWLFLALPLAYLIIFAYYPMLGVQIAFRDFRAKAGILGSKWFGLHWFREFLNNYQFREIFSNNLSKKF